MTDAWCLPLTNAVEWTMDVWRVDRLRSADGPRQRSLSRTDRGGPFHQSGADADVRNKVNSDDVTALQLVGRIQLTSRRSVESTFDVIS